MRFARVIGNDDPLVLKIDSDIFHTVDFHQERAQSPQTFMTIFAVGRDLDLVENRVVSALMKKWIGWFDLVWFGWVHNILNFRANRWNWSCAGAPFSPLLTHSRQHPLVRSAYNAASRAIGSSTRQRFSARIFWPAALG